MNFAHADPNKLYYCVIHLQYKHIVQRVFNMTESVRIIANGSI